MRLGQRSTRGRPGPGRQLILPILGPLLASLCMQPATAIARAASAGPGRIVCNASFCELGSGARPKERFRVIISELPRDEIKRLRACTGVSKPCIVTVDGAEQDKPMRILAESVHWQD